MMPEVIEECAARLRVAREQYSALRAMGGPAQYEDCKEWSAPAVSDTMSVALCEWVASEPARSAEPQRKHGIYVYLVAWHAMHAPAPHEALLPRLRWWFPTDRISDPTLVEWTQRAVASVAQASRVFGIAVLRVWCDAWATSAVGIGSSDCRRQGGGRPSHLVRCAPLWRPTEHAALIPPPRSLRQALCLEVSETTPGRSPGCRRRPSVSVMALAVATDAHHKLRTRRLSGSEARAPLAEHTVRAAATHIARRFGRL